MDFQDKASEIVDQWIQGNLLYLKDGGGAAGVHKAARNDLISRLNIAFTQIASEQKKAPAKRAKRVDKS